MKALALATLFISLLSSNLSSAVNFPLSPNEQMTPGKLCSSSDNTRYPERIRYCNRDVSSDLKQQIIVNYDRAFGYRIESLPRDQFKIDHYIPLCVGGANDMSNLWPQHVSVYSITDSLEELVCKKMAEGKLRQKDAIKIIIEGKHHLDDVPEILHHVGAL
ncbi:MAG TPA: hypothetical protein VIG33_00025 [Pseudobdellovibrionaceae bacterium]|jgi:hypothetical protein